MRQDREVRDTGFAWMVVLLVHASIATWLLRLQWPVAVSRGEDEALQVEFIHRPRLAPASRAGATAARPRVARAAPLRPERSARSSLVVEAPPSTAGANASRNGLEPPRAGRALDLRLPDAPVPAATPDPFERKALMEPRGTRFERVWAPAGNALDQARFRSKLVGGALGLFGGPPRRCGEIERRLRKPDCLALHGQEAEDEVLRQRALE